MNAVTIIEAAVPVPGFEEWLGRLRELFDQRHRAHWRIADALREGKDAGFLTQVGFDFLSGELGVAPKAFKDAIKAAEAFPPALRDQSLSIEHHAAAANLPDAQMKLEFLSRAKREHWTPEQTRHEALKSRTQEGRPDESPLESFIRHWNRLPRAVRIEAAEMIAEANGDLIEP